MKKEVLLKNYELVRGVYEERRRLYEEAEGCLASLYREIVAVMRREGISQGDIAERLGIARCYLSRLESGERPVLAKHFEALGNLLKAGGIESETKM